MNWPERLARPCLNPLQDGDRNAMQTSADLISQLELTDCLNLSLRPTLLLNERETSFCLAIHFYHDGKP